MVQPAQLSVTSLSFALVAGGYLWILRRRNVSVFEGLALSRISGACRHDRYRKWPGSPHSSLRRFLSLVGNAVGVFLYWGVFSLGIVQVDELESLVQSLPGTFRKAESLCFNGGSVVVAV